MNEDTALGLGLSIGLLIGTLFTGPLLYRSYGGFGTNELTERGIIQYNVKTGKLEYAEDYKKESE